MQSFILPFQDSWFTFWGGDTKELNYHHDNEAQRYAFDFTIQKNGKSFSKKGRLNEDYLCFNEDVIAPADGEVVQVVNGIEDNKPGFMNGYYAPGNSITIKHAEDVYSFIAHFKLNSIKVKVGDKIKQGKVLGFCGNSGNSSEPHIHFQLQDHQNILYARGIKCHFKKVEVTRDGKTATETDYSPIKNDFVSN